KSCCSSRSTGSTNNRSRLGETSHSILQTEAPASAGAGISTQDKLSIRPAVASDADTIVHFIRELADYEKLLHEVKITAADIARDLFGAEPKVFCEIAEWDGQPVGFALWFYTYSAFQGRHGI